LATDGWLIVSPTETSQELFCEFTTVSFGDVTFYRKSATRLSTTDALSVYAEGLSSLRLSEWVVKTPESARTSSLQTTTSLEDSHDEAHPQNTAPPAVSYEQALAFYEQGRYGEVERVIPALLSADGNHASVMLLLARAYANQGKLPAALAWCEKAIAADKMAARAYYLRATILQEQGCLPEALLAFRQAVYAEPQFILGHFALGNLASQQGRHKESEKHFENVLLLLARCEPEEIVLESEGLSVGRLREAIGLRTSQDTLAATRIPQPNLNLEVNRR
jgi:chemotaxis protein methyltransferase CheR